MLTNDGAGADAEADAIDDVCNGAIFSPWELIVLCTAVGGHLISFPFFSGYGLKLTNKSRTRLSEAMRLFGTLHHMSDLIWNGCEIDV